MKYKAIILVALVAFVAAGCTEVVTTTTPGAVDVTITNPGTTDPTTPTTPDGPTGTITLEPSSISVAVGKNANVKVVVRDELGTEIPSSNISVNIIDKTILNLVEIDGRIIAFGGVAPGGTAVIVSASGLQTSLVATVTP